MKLEVGQVRLVREDAKLHPGAKLKVGDKMVIKTIDSFGPYNNAIVCYLSIKGEMAHTTRGWIELYTDAL